jgi:hypothetical protein
MSSFSGLFRYTYWRGAKRRTDPIRFASLDVLAPQEAPGAKGGTMTIRGEVPTDFVAALRLAVVGSLCYRGEAKAGINCTYDPTIDAANDAGTYAFLNTALAGLYKSAFTNANANIYTTCGTTGELPKQGVIR